MSEFLNMGQSEAQPYGFGFSDRHAVEIIKNGITDALSSIGGSRLAPDEAHLMAVGIYHGLVEGGLV